MIEEISNEPDASLRVLHALLDGLNIRIAWVLFPIRIIS